MSAPWRGVEPTAQPAACALPYQVHASPCHGMTTLVAAYHVHWPNGKCGSYGPALPCTLIAKTPRLPMAAGRLASAAVGGMVRPGPARPHSDPPPGQALSR